ncbi:hypothetical protein LXA43DRAFT_1122323 [Ganoderma leucocontextum]|nr:hypothetical protein LXA43DRAFT_1122323 [Ganoderma leucocontextum]
MLADLVWTVSQIGARVHSLHASVSVANTWSHLLTATVWTSEVGMWGHARQDGMDGRKSSAWRCEVLCPLSSSLSDACMGFSEDRSNLSVTWVSAPARTTLVPATWSNPVHARSPAIHGADAPNGDVATVVPHRMSYADAGDDTLWPGYGEVYAPSPTDLCEVHGMMCSSGICRQQCGLCKRDTKRELRIQKQLEEREALSPLPSR